ncbi:Holliday junction branch migration protein RuvA [Spiroplasma endosymbiont of Panorpa germanica]|uniref:Holliday junction branch migration protein RuvA n=1 Tax=Spiroplasma endosymbiont of Panorpa germanica TaxID=3066314 RepID=UPI0030D60C9E
MHYVIGKIQEITRKYLIIQTEQNIGYKFNHFKVLGDEDFNQDHPKDRVYLAEVKSDFESFIYCFRNEQSQSLFLELNKIKTVGTKTAKLIMKNFRYEDFLEIVRNNEYEKLEDLKNIGSFTAKVIINELQKVYFKITYNSKQLSVIESLQKLGYNQKRIYQAVSKIDNNLKIEEMFQKVLGRVVENEQSSF